jgi:hypothetical protein
MVGLRNDYDKIAIMVPTYGRHNSYLPAFVDSALSTMTDSETIEFRFCVNKNDGETKNYIKNKSFKGCHVHLLEEDLGKPSLSVFFNMLYATFSDPKTIVTLLGDDMIYRTPGWDRRMLDLINLHEGVGVFWGNDDYIAREKMCVNMFVSRQFVEATEHPFMCEEFDADMVDVLWYRVGQFTKSLHYDPNIHIWHNHNGSKKKENWDATFKRLQPARDQGHRVGKGRCDEVAREIADILISKGLTGESVC